MKPNYSYTVTQVGKDFAVRADHRGHLVAFRETEQAAQAVADDLQRKADKRFKKT